MLHLSLHTPSLKSSKNKNVADMKVKLELHCNGKQEGKWSQIAFDNVKVRKYYDEEPGYCIWDE